MRRNVLLISPGDDIHSLAITDRIAKFYRGGVSCWIFDTATHPLTSRLSTRIEDDRVNSILHVAPPLGRTLGPRTADLLRQREPSTEDHAVLLGPDTAVWWRRYRRPVLHPDVVEPEFREFCLAALETVLFGALSQCAVYNPLGSEDPADWKLRQLALAQQCGLRVPATIFSTNRAEVEQFVDAVEGRGKRVVYKHATAIAAFGMPTRVVDAAARSRFDALQYAPSIFQEEIAGGLDLRIAVIGSRIFCCEWRGTAPEREFADVKLEEGLRMWPGRLPAGLSGPLLDFQSRIGLTFGIYDFKLDADGNAYFLEVNPSGQWLDMEVEGGQPISEAIARVLVEGRGVESTGEAEPLQVADLERLYAAVPQEQPKNWTKLI